MYYDKLISHTEDFQMMYVDIPHSLPVSVRVCVDFPPEYSIERGQTLARIKVNIIGDRPCDSMM